MPTTRRCARIAEGSAAPHFPGARGDFHFANAAMPPLFGEMRAKGKGRSLMTGRFKLTLGAISTAVGIGAALDQVIAGPTL
jgi:hypothetical protein